MYDIEQLDNVLVFRFLEKGNLSNSCAGNTLILALEPDLLQSDNTVRVVQLSGLINDAVCSWGATTR
jgi:hypothetical protein